MTTYQCDITSAESVKSTFLTIEHDLALLNTVRTEQIFPSILVNTAGYVSISNLEDTKSEESMKHLTTNILGPMLCSQAFAKLYFSLCEKVEAGSSQPPPGRIVSISSQAAHSALYRHGAYCASKAGLLGLTRSMAAEWGGRGITANTVSPTISWTPLAQKAWGDQSVREAFLKTIPTGRFALPQEVADAILFLCQVSILFFFFFFPVRECES